MKNPDSLARVVRRDIQRFIYRTILEGKEDWIKQNLGKKIEAAMSRDYTTKGMDLDVVIELFKKGDPTPNSKYISWIALQYANNRFRVGEDLAQIRRALGLFIKFSREIFDTDINSYDLATLYRTIMPFMGREDEATTPSEHKKNIKVIVDTPNLKIIVPLTKEASIAWGGGTQWCTAADDTKNKDVYNHFDSYNSKAPLYIIISERGKFQLHGYLDEDPYSGEENSYIEISFMDANDYDISDEDKRYLESIPEYMTFINSFINDLYSGYMSGKVNLVLILYNQNLSLKSLVSRNLVPNIIQQNPKLKHIHEIRQQALNAVKIFSKKVASSLGLDEKDFENKCREHIAPSEYTFLEQSAIDIAEHQSDGSLNSFLGCVRSSATRFTEVAKRFRQEVDDYAAKPDTKMDFANVRDILRNLGRGYVVDGNAMKGDDVWWEWMIDIYSESIRKQLYQEIEQNL